MATVSAQPVPPTAGQLLDHVRANLPVRSPARRYAFFILLGLLIGSLLVGTVSVPLQGLLMVAAMGVVVWMFSQRRVAERVQQRLQQLHELVLLRHDGPAAELAWQLLPDVRYLPDAHVQAVMMLAISCARLEAYDSSLAAQGYLLEHISPSHPTSQLIRLQQVMSMLHEDQLVDADEEIRRLSRTELPGAGSAMLQLASLYQQIKTHHHADVIEQAGTIAPSLKLLGVEAGYGYAMLATAFHYAGQPADTADWWQRATLLLPASVIMHDIPETAVLRELPSEPPVSAWMMRDRENGGKP